MVFITLKENMGAHSIELEEKELLYLDLKVDSIYFGLRHMSKKVILRSDTSDR